MKNLSIILSLTIIGVAAAFFRPAQPHQAPSQVFEVPRGGFIFDSSPQFFDEGLDNPLVEADDSINAARKCGFCMGVSLLLHIVLVMIGSIASVVHFIPTGDTKKKFWICSDWSLCDIRLASAPN